MPTKYIHVVTTQIHGDFDEDPLLIGSPYLLVLYWQPISDAFATWFSESLSTFSLITYA